MNAQRAGDVIIGDGSEAKGFSKNPDKIYTFEKSDNVHINVVRDLFPQYYASPTPREYVLPKGAYKYIVETSLNLENMICQAINAPAAPLYLGSNDGWVDVEWEALS